MNLLFSAKNPLRVICYYSLKPLLIANFAFGFMDLKAYEENL
jgi:hypothetical protein